MLLYFLALSFTGIIILYNNPRSAANRWASLFLLFASLGGPAYWLNEYLAGFGGPAEGDGGKFIIVGEGIAAGLNFINQTLTPYAVLMFAIVYGQAAQDGWKQRWSYLLLLPVAGMLISVPLSDFGWELHPALLLSWAGPYYAVACGLLIYGYWREHDRYARRHRRMTMIIMVPTLAAIIGFILLGRVWNPQFDFFRYVAVFVAYSLVVGLALSFFTGVLGVRMRMESEPLDAAWKAIHSGTSVLNHTLKNEIGKISISTDNLRHRLPEEEAYQRPLDIISRSTGHLEAMVERIQAHTQDIVLKEEPIRLAELVEESLQQMEVILAKHQVRVDTEVDPQEAVVMDRAHLREVLCNLMQNASEAMGTSGGKLVIRSSRRGKRTVLSVADNGEGIPAHLLKEVMQPFFSTRDRRSNYGLGLSYCRLVMEKSGGRLSLESSPGEGTTVRLEFPRWKRRK